MQRSIDLTIYTLMIGKKRLINERRHNSIEYGCTDRVCLPHCPICILWNYYYWRLNKMVNYDRFEIIKDEKNVNKLLLFRNDKLIDSFYLNDLIIAALKYYNYNKL